MQEGIPSRTAYQVAVRRAAHQVLDDPRVFEDPLALPIIGLTAESILQDSRVNGTMGRALRAFMAVRSRYAEDELAMAVERGIQQYVVLGAGLDTFAYRNPFRSAGLRVFEVDHPVTQAWKHDILRRAEIEIPPELTFAAIDFERQSLEDGLAEAGFRADEGAFFSWLGVTPYLTEESFMKTVDFIARQPASSGVVFDFAVDRALLSPWERAVLDALAARLKAAGEPFQLFFDPAKLAADLKQRGFGWVENLGPKEINCRYFAGRADGLSLPGGAGHLLSARVGSL